MILARFLKIKKCLSLILAAVFLFTSAAGFPAGSPGTWPGAEEAQAATTGEAPASLTGNWQTEAYVQSGPGQGNTYRGWITLYQQGDQLTGIFYSHPYSGTCSGTYRDGIVNLDCTTDDGYQSHITATVSGDGKQIQGTWSDNYGNSGTYTASRLTAMSYIGLEASLNVAKLDPLLRSIQSFIADPVDTATGAHAIERPLLTVNGAWPLSLRLRYNSLLLQEGPLGKGWEHNFETRLATLPAGDVDLKWSANRVNRFIKSGDNFSSPDLATRYDTLVKNADGSFTLTRKDQSVYKFNTEGRLIQQQNSHGQPLDFTYDDSGRLGKISEPLSGQALTLNYNANNLIDKITGSAGRQVLFTYDAAHNLTGITGARGETTTYTYNAKGQVLTAVDPEGAQIFSNTYDEKGCVVAQEDAVATNQPARFSYDEESEPGKIITSVTGRTGQMRTIDHNSDYQLLSVKDELGDITVSNTYDLCGNRTKATDANGNAASFTYDEKGNLLTGADARGNITKMTYDGRNNLLSLENAAGKKITFAYDAKNNLTGVTDPAGNTTTCAYDENSLLLTRTTPGGGKTTFTYQNGLPQTATSPVGNKTTYGYDAAGRLTGITNAAGKTTTLAYDPADNLTGQTDPLGHTTSFTYDSHRRKLTETDPEGNTTRFTYNGNGRLTSRTDALNNQIRYEYDGEDRLLRTIDARGNAISFNYDAKGRLTGITDPLGNSRSFQYDPADNLTGQTDALGSRILTIGYDAANNPATVKDAFGYTTTNQYDSLNRLSQVTDPLNRITGFDYDSLNRPVSTTDPLAGQSSQGFDKDGNRVTLKDPNNNQTGFTYDAAGRLTGETSAAGSMLTYRYNNRDLLEQTTNGRGQTTTFQYDAAGRLTSFSDPLGGVSYTYDANGNILTTVSGGTAAPPQTITREYDALDRVTKYTDASGNTIQYAYDSAGNLITLTYPGGRQVNYTYDAANRLVKVTDWAGRVTSYEYDANGRLVKTTRPNGTVETRGYDAAGQLLQKKDVAKNGSIIAQDDFTYNEAGNVITEKKTSGGQPSTYLYGYDALSRLLEQKEANFTTNSTASMHDYTYDAGGNITSAQSANGLPPASMTYTYDNRLATYNGNTVTHDADGNMTAGPLSSGLIMGSFTYDARNRLTGAGSVSYRYDAENQRTGIIENGKQTSYVINPHATLSQALVKTDPQGSQTFYVYGPGLIGQEENGVYRAYHFDRRGGTVALTDANGLVTDRFKYGPYGELLAHEGTTATPFLSNGRYGVMTDANGLYYMRARYYNPQIRRFVNKDVLSGNIIDGRSLNRYAYANGEPVSYVDPFGLCAEDALNFFQGTADVLSELLLPDPNNPWDMAMLQLETGAPRVLQAAGATGILGRKGATKAAQVVEDFVKKKGQTHHIATNKAIKSGYTKELEKIFNKGGMSLEDEANKVFLEGHAGRHSDKYHRHVKERLEEATEGLSGDAYKEALQQELKTLKAELLRNPDMIRGTGLPD